MLVCIEDSHKLGCRMACWPGYLRADRKLVCLPVDCEADPGWQREEAELAPWGQSADGRRLLGRLWHDDMRAARRRASRKWASLEPGQVGFSTQAD
jgi:hypothetical protein